MRPWIFVALLIIIITLLFSILFFVSKISEDNPIKPIIKYPPTQNLECDTNQECKDKFNDNWFCSGTQEKCVCPVTTQLSPTCGIDGKTYENPSEARCAGIEINYYGECREEGKLPKKCIVCGNDCQLIDPNLDLRIECSETTEAFECRLANGKCIRIDGNGFCGDGFCESTFCSTSLNPRCQPEDEISCPQDCSKEDKFCWRCGDSCSTSDTSIPSVCPTPTDINIECKIINGKCTANIL